MPAQVQSHKSSTFRELESAIAKLPEDTTALSVSERGRSSSLLPGASLRRFRGLVSLALYAEALDVLPEGLAELHTLESLTIQMRPNISDKRATQPGELPEGVGSLVSLRELRLTKCHTITKLPDLSRLKALTSLHVSKCIRLAALPNSLGELTALTSLEVLSCAPGNRTKVGQFTEIPESIGQLAALTHLDLSGCRDVRALPDSIGQCVALQTLLLQDTGLRTLPESVGALTNLRILDLHSDYANLTSLPDAIGLLTALQTLDLRGLRLKALPSTLGDLHSLTRLDLRNCNTLKSLPDSVRSLRRRRLRLRVLLPEHLRHPWLREDSIARSVVCFPCAASMTLCACIGYLSYADPDD